jgi:hypothetical protein
MHALGGRKSVLESRHDTAYGVAILLMEGSRTKQAVPNASSHQTDFFAMQEDSLIIKPLMKATVSILVRRGDETEHYHVTQEQFCKGDIPEVIARRFDLWENLAAERSRVIPLLEEEQTTFISTSSGTGEVQQVRERSNGEQVVRVIFYDGHSQKYRVRKATATVLVPIDAPSDRDGEASILLQHYLDVSLQTLTMDASQRDDSHQEHPGTETIVREMKRSFQEGVVRTSDGRRVEPDHPDSPLRKHGFI